MKALKNWLFPETALPTLLAIRPLAISMLEDMQVRPYVVPAVRIGDACKQAGVAWETFLQRMENLGIPARGSDWAHLPICRLLDFLTQEHRDFAETFIPAIKAGFASGEGRKDFLGTLHPLIKAWPAFSASLIEHMAAEEAFLFPKILRYAYCVKHHQVDPDFSDGSVKVFAAVHLMRGEEKQMVAISEFMEATAFSAFAGTMDAPAAGLFHLLETFQARLTEHSRMEREILYPLAEGLERRLYDIYINGGTDPRIANPELSPA